MKKSSSPPDLFQIASMELYCWTKRLDKKSTTVVHFEQWTKQPLQKTKNQNPPPKKPLTRNATAKPTSLTLRNLTITKQNLESLVSWRVFWAFWVFLMLFSWILFILFGRGGEVGELLLLLCFNNSSQTLSHLFTNCILLDWFKSLLPHLYFSFCNN